MNRLQSFAEAWVRDWNAHDLEVILRHYAEDVVFRSPKIARYTDSDVDTLKGRDALRPYFAKGLASRPNLRFDLIVATTDHDGVAIAQGCQVHLAKRGGGEMLFIKKGERFGNAHAQFTGDDLLHLGIREGFHFVLQAGKRFKIRLGQKVGTA